MPSTSSPAHQSRIAGEVLVEPAACGRRSGCPGRRRSAGSSSPATNVSSRRPPDSSVELGELPGQHVRVAARRHEVRAELEARHPGGGERQADERVDAAALERLGQPDRVEAERVEVVEHGAEALEGEGADGDADAHLHRRSLPDPCRDGAMMEAW